MKHFFATLIFLIHPTLANDITCRTGEVCHLDDPTLPKMVCALKDAHVVYTQDVDGRLYSFTADAQNKLTRTKIFRLPVLGEFYNSFYPNNLSLERNPCDFNPWAISFTQYEQPDCSTVSLFEMTNCYPIVLRNRDPWLSPGLSYNHAGPLGVVGMDITAMDKWVAISGIRVKDKKKVFALRELNYDLAGHNPLMTYQLPNGKLLEPSRFGKWLAKKIGVSQKPISLPKPDWQIFELPDNSQPDILFRRNNGHIWLDIPLAEGQHTYFDFETQLYVPSVLPSLLAELSVHKSWPTQDIFGIIPFQTHIYRAHLNGVKGYFERSSAEPVLGRFIDEKGNKTDIYMAIRSLWGFLMNKPHFFDEQGRSIQISSKKATDQSPLNIQQTTYGSNDNEHSKMLDAQNPSKAYNIISKFWEQSISLVLEE